MRRSLAGGCCIMKRPSTMQTDASSLSVGCSRLLSLLRWLPATGLLTWLTRFVVLVAVLFRLSDSVPSRASIALRYLVTNAIIRNCCLNRIELMSPTVSTVTTPVRIRIVYNDPTVRWPVWHANVLDTPMR